MTLQHFAGFETYPTQHCVTWWLKHMALTLGSGWVGRNSVSR